MFNSLDFTKSTVKMDMQAGFSVNKPIKAFYLQSNVNKITHIHKRK